MVFGDEENLKREPQSKVCVTVYTFENIFQRKKKEEAAGFNRYG